MKWFGNGNRNSSLSNTAHLLKRSFTSFKGFTITAAIVKGKLQTEEFPEKYGFVHQFYRFDFRNSVGVMPWISLKDPLKKSL